MAYISFMPASSSGYSKNACPMQSQDNSYVAQSIHLLIKGLLFNLYLSSFDKFRFSEIFLFWDLHLQFPVEAAKYSEGVVNNYSS